MKRTTVSLEDACIEEVRRIAQREGRRFSEVVNMLLVEALQRRRTASRRKIDLPSFSMGRPHVDLSDRNALERLMSC